MVPMVTVIIPAHNEELWIERKIENTLALDYPRDRIEILVASDGSTDSTVGLSHRFLSQGVEVLSYPERSGKLTALNRVVPRAKGEILIFTDTKAMLDNDVLQRLIPHYEDPHVAGVVGNRVCVATDSPATEGEGLYWRFEAWIRRSESRFYSCLGACGQIYSVRKSVYPFVSGFSDDTVIPLKASITPDSVIAFEPRALARIPAAATLRQEWERKVRSHLAFFYDIAHLKGAVNPVTSRIAWQFWSHHILRYIVPWAMLVSFLTSAWMFGTGRLYGGVFYTQALFYAAAFVGFLLSRRGLRWQPFYACFYFTLANAAVGYAWIQRIRGKRQYAWRQVDRILPAGASLKAP
jgi:biofilm PGA synthesis N-glycosyltransferase PgaC